MSTKNCSFIYYFHIWFHRHLFGFCPECNSSAPEIDNCPICHNDRTSPFNKKKRKLYWLKWRVLHGFVHVHLSKEEKLFWLEQQLDIPYKLRYYNTKKNINMCGSIEFGTCPICKQEKPLNRKYFHYNVDCVCCGGAAKDYHFEIAYHCNDCEPIKPEKIKPTLKASTYEISNEN